jgi:predicted nucleic acid-binding protein
MRIIVSDSSCLIDLRKVSLLETCLKLPYEFLIPDTLFEEELLKFTPTQKRDLLRWGLKVIDLPGERVLRAQQVVRTNPRLSVHDAFAFVLAEGSPGSILLTGDGVLRALSDQQKIEVHGVLWILDELHRCSLARAELILLALREFATDPTVRLPRREVAGYVRRYEGMK